MRNKKMDPIVEKRLKVIEFADQIGNISEACRTYGMNRSSFYEWKKRYDQFGIKGLKDLPSTPKNNPRTTPQEIVVDIVEISLNNPSWGCIRIAEQMKLKNIMISPPTVQKILIKHNISTIKTRWSKLEEIYISENYKLSEEQISKIEKLNPAFKERTKQISLPGQLLCADIYYVGKSRSLGKVYMSLIIDAYSLMSFVDLHTDENADRITTLLHTKVMPFYKENDININEVFIGASQKLSSINNSFKSYLRINGITNIQNKDSRLQRSGFAEKFKLISHIEFFKSSLKEDVYNNVESLKQDFSKWLYEYNYKTKSEGYPNFSDIPYNRLLKSKKYSNIKNIKEIS